MAEEVNYNYINYIQLARSLTQEYSDAKGAHF